MASRKEKLASQSSKSRTKRSHSVKVMSDWRSVSMWSSAELAYLEGRRRGAEGHGSSRKGPWKAMEGYGGSWKAVEGPGDPP